MEQAYINTNHPEFVGGGKAIQKIMQERAHNELNKESRGGHLPSNPFAQSTPAVRIERQGFVYWRF